MGNATYTIRYQGRGLTLVELLVVVAKVGLLIALLLPAVQAARESARRATCKNHLRQIALTWHTHMQAHGHFPTGGWPRFTGDPTRGFSKKQPGEWPFNVLPYVEEQSLHDLGLQDNDGLTIQAAAYIKRAETPVEAFNCPSRRPARAVSIPSRSVDRFNDVRPLNVSPQGFGTDSRMEGLFLIDYAANEGHGPVLDRVVSAPPRDYREGDQTGFLWPDDSTSRGVCFDRAAIRDQDIEDGLSNTYAVGEKRVDPADYYGENANAVGGELDEFDFDEPYGGLNGINSVTRRKVGSNVFGVIEPLAPAADTAELPNFDRHTLRRFGSAHEASFHMSFCDGSVRTVGYDIDPNLHVGLGLRNDGLPADLEMRGPFLPVRVD